MYPSTLIQEHVTRYLSELLQRKTHLSRRIGLAISGGVDSMALATLCRESQSACSFTGFIVDHGLRQNSSEEAIKVADQLHSIGIEPRILRLDWNAYGDPRNMTNFEAVARRLRYQAIGKGCYREGIRSLLVGHHADDQAETVLTRIVSGYLGAGIAGIQPEAGIPECSGIYGVDGSGCIIASDMESEGQYEHPHDAIVIESGGVNLCRPLLPFTKDQLIQVCREKEVKWFEDPTNKDQTLTVRNTIRHLHEQAVLPAALQRNRLCPMALATKNKNSYIDAEVDRLFNSIDVELDVRLGKVTFTIDFEMIERWTPHSTTIMHRIKASLLRKLMHLITSRSILLPDLESAVQMVFSRHLHFQAMQIGKVNIQPAKRDDNNTFESSGYKTIVLCRQKPSTKDVRMTSQLTILNHDKHGTDFDEAGWLLWDDRYWIRMQSAPLAPSCMFVRFITPNMLGTLRKSLNKQQRLVLQHKLDAAKEHDIRWTLPAIVAQEGDEETVIALPTLRWENAAFLDSYAERSGNAEIPFTLDIRYKNVDILRSERHRIIS